MNKLFTLLFLTAALFSFKGIAQTAPCTSLSVNFTYQAGSPNTNVLAFTNTSTGYAVGDTIQWTFGDGGTSSVSNPTHTYTSGGVKQVCLIIRKVVQPGASPCVNYHCTQINVVIPNTACNLNVSYTSQALGTQPNVIQFTSTSTGYATGDTILWTFGDGSSSSTLNPLHTFATGGTYHVCLTIRKVVPAGVAPCVNYSCLDIVVTMPCTLSASFISQPSSSNSLGVYFTNTSTGYAAGDSLVWSFGDGTYAYNIATAYHAYANAGTYTVCLHVRKASTGTTISTCVSDICHTVIVTAPFVCDLSVSYTYAATPNGPNVISFTNTSTGYAPADTIQWTFGDGTTSSVSNPTHTYTTAGTYQVCLIIKRVVPAGVAACANYSCHSIVVTLPCNLTASFTSQPSTSNPLGVYFTNTSTGYAAGDSLVWSFGDGTYAYNTAPAYHVYANAGIYNVCLHVRKASTGSTPSTCVSDICHTITVVAPCTLSASFTTTQTPQPSIIMFTNTSTGYAAGDSILWTFGDGSSSSQPNPTHTYATGNTYHVCLTIIKHTAVGVAPCSSTICHDIAVTVPVCTLSASFSSQTGSNMTVYFTNTSAGFATGDSIHWSFGDGTDSYTTNSVHTYTAAGVYTVCLWVKKNNVSGTSPCVSEICHTVTVSAACNLVVSYTATPAAGSPNVIQFTSTSTGYAVGDTISWTFGDGSSSTTLNPIHTYAAAGTYQVCLIIKKAVAPGTAPCVNYHCGSITVTLPCTLSASFTSQPSTSNPLGVYFTSTTTGYAAGDTLVWSFGDGTYAYNTPTAYHAYANAGTYNVCLWVKKNNTSPNVPACVSEICHTVTVTAPCTLNASFTSQPSTSNPLGVYFTNTSAGYATGDSIRWSFGDGTTAYTPNAYHVYANAGVYNVCLWVKKNNSSATTPACVSQTCHTVIVSLPCNLAVSYTSTATAGAPNVIQFTSTSTGYAAGDTIQWTFGDGSTSATLNPLHTFATGGTYHVCLIIRKAVAAGTAACANYSCHDIVVENACTLVSGYTQHADSQNYLLIHFTNTTTPVNTNSSVTWYFGDGSTATTWNADHQYAHAGTYNACLRVQYGTCVSYHCDSVHIVEPQISCSQLANFHYTAISATGLGAIFTPDHIYSDVTYTWTFGDGTGSHDIPATHVFATAGYYTVCLAAYRNNSCAATSCTIVHLPSGSTPNCNDITLGFVTTTNTSSLNSVTFTGSSNAPILDQVWTITRVPATVANGTVTLHAINPTYAFSDTGMYNVCLHATFAGGCTRDYCRQIHVSFPVAGTNPCSLQLYPNPATSTINAMVTLTQASVINTTVYNSSNMQVIQKEQQGVVGINTVNLNIASLPAGVYTMRVSYGNQYCYATFIKQ